MHFVFACGLKHDEDADVDDLYKRCEYHRGGPVLQLHILTDGDDLYKLCEYHRGRVIQLHILADVEEN